jgi:glycosyltransferase involved in cell wall biosynthesis
MKDSPIRVLALVHSIPDTSPGQRFRLEQWEPKLRELGVEVTFTAFEDAELHALLYRPGHWLEKMRLISNAFGRRARLMKTLGSYDAVYVLREASLLGPPVFERWVHRAGIPMVFDFDDAVFVPYRSPSNGWLSLLKFSGKTRTACQLASHVMAGNPYLAEYASSVNPNVTMIPTTIDTAKYRIEPRAASEVPVIGWTGSYSTVQHLDTLRGALQRLAREERFLLRVIGTPRYELGGVEVEAMPWRANTEIEDLRAIDIGIMPLPDDAWSRGKCGLKALQYMALGVPTVCSPVGVNVDIIADGENGSLAGSDEEWVHKLTLLLRSAPLRQRLGMAGRRTVETRYSADVYAPKVCEVFRSVVQNRRAPIISAKPPQGREAAVWKN